MFAVNLIASALAPIDPPEVPQEGVCCVTGDFGLTIHRKHAIKPSMTTLDLLNAPDSDRVSVDAWMALGHKWERMSSWIVSNQGFDRITDKARARELVFAGVRPDPWSGYITTSYKKHGALLAPVNGPTQAVWLFEMLTVDVSNSAKVREWWGILSAAQYAGIPRPVLETLDINPSLYARVGFAKVREFRVWAEPRFRDPLYQLLVYLLPTQEEIKKQKQQES